MFNQIKKLLGMEYEIDSKIFKRALTSYPYGSVESTGSYIRHITNVQAFQKGNHVRVLIESHSPGILIGKAGKQISEIREYMEYLSGKSVSTNIRETEIFRNLYK